nr:uncharacterized protein LOC105490036 [Macaca nemestrina]
MGRVPKALPLAPRKHKARFLQKQVHLGRLETLCAEAVSSRFGELGVEVGGGSSSSPAFWAPGAASLRPRPRLCPPSRARASSAVSKSSRRAAPGTRCSLREFGVARTRRTAETRGRSEREPVHAPAERPRTLQPPRGAVPAGARRALP